MQKDLTLTAQLGCGDVEKKTKNINFGAKYFPQNSALQIHHDIFPRLYPKFHPQFSLTAILRLFMMWPETLIILGSDMIAQINWGTFWTAVAALAALAALYLPIRAIIKKKKSKKIQVFISMQMTHLNPSEYVEVREELMNLIYELRKTHDVYFYNEFVPKISYFDEKQLDTYEYLKRIKKCDYFISIISEKILSSIYFEAGYAAALGKDSIYFVTDDRVMPLLMRLISSDQPNIKVIKASSLDEIKPRIINILNNLREIKIT